MYPWTGERENDTSGDLDCIVSSLVAQSLVSDVAVPAMQARLGMVEFFELEDSRNVCGGARGVAGLVRVNEFSLGRGMRMRRFISRLKSVKNMSLSLAAWRQGLVFLSLKNEGELRAWASHVGGLLNCIVQRGCTSLIITDGSSIESDRPSVLNWMVRWLIPKGSNDMPTLLSAFPAGPLHLTTLITDSATLMVSPGTEWVLAALRQALIIALCLRVARPLALAVPPLRHLKKLRLLKELHARAEPAEHFLSSEGALPELFMLCVLCLAPPGLNLDPLLTLLVPIAAKLRAHPRLPRLTLSVGTRAGFAAADVVALDLSANLPVDDGGQIAEGCARVERIELDLDVDDHRGKATDDVLGVARLLAVLPNVMSVSLSARGTIPESSVIRLVQNNPPTTSLMEIQLNGKMYRSHAKDTPSLWAFEKDER
ncbi:hypothetical protein DFH08DRAFT_1001837 [Mycena albidolilacea]|uniref:Uncharacterized protein n=1 Tax=Mycena albidolilacea TaxID=1033008 RepID=A0AAD7A1J0_9AGAR|nr:hypothetical protein DFH08DRAFT_1001837 [Mycena albidolilacea]